MSSSSSSSQAPSSPFVPYAEKLASFPKTTREPLASMSSPGGSKDEIMKLAPALTIAETPQLATKKRKRTTHFQSAAELEEQELREIRAKKFKARPVMDAHTGFKPVDPAPPTQIEEFHFHETKHPAYKPPPPKKFKARPYKPKVFEKNLEEILNPDLPAGPLTCPVTPNLSKPRPRTQRSKSHSRDLEEAQRHQRFKARPAPRRAKAKKSFRSASSERDFGGKRPLTRPSAPNFRVDSRGRDKVAKFAAMVHARERERKTKATYRANKVPKASRSAREKPTGIPVVKKAAPTVQDPFNLASVAKHSMSKAKFEANIRAEEQAEKEAKKFRAQKAPKFNKTAEEVVAAAREQAKAKAAKATESKGMNFATDERTAEREKFDAEVRAKQAAVEAEKEAKAREDEEHEKEIVAEMRKEMVFHAQPIKEGKPVEIRPSERAPTNARTPDFKTTQRLGEFYRAPGLEEVVKSPPKADYDASSTSAKRELTNPKTPEFATTHRLGKPSARQSEKKATPPKEPVPWPAKKELTNPKTPDFATNQRLGKRSARKSERKTPAADASAPQSNKKLAVTIPKTPDFSTSRRLGEHRMEVPPECKEKENSIGAGNSSKPKLTLPKTPNFATSRRFGAPKPAGAE